MSNLIKNKGWKPVKLEGIIDENDLEGLVGIEELNDYDLNNAFKTTKPKTNKCKLSETQPEEKQNKVLRNDKNKKRKRSDCETVQNTKNIESISDKPGAFVRNPIFIPKSNKKNEPKKGSGKLKQKIEIGQTNKTDENLNKCTVDDLHEWGIVALPDPLLQGLADLGFTKPTTIQELTLPAAIFGRRDILGAAETGSGKTLAFGLPILTGILKHKEELAENITNLSTEGNDEDNNTDETCKQENTNDQDSDQSDFEEREENVDNETINGIGCVRSIDNIQVEEGNDKHLRPLYALILTPTRELAVQIKNHLIAVAKHTDIRIAVVMGGMAAVKQKRILSKCPEIVVATPGRLWELIQEGNPHLSQIDNIKYLAIDETDRMIEKYHFQELHHLLERINLDEDKRNKRQTFVFSATLTMVHDLPRYLAKKKKLKHSSKIHKLTSEEKIKNIVDMLGITDPKIVDVTKETVGTAKSLVECRINCALEEKDFYVYYFLQKHPGRTLIFCNSIGCVKRLAHLLTILGCTSLPLHAAMQQRQRLKNLERFRDNALGILVATDVAARGLDVPSVEHVLHYQTPRTSESYVHRSGRTARALKEGITILLIEPNEINSYVKMCNTLGRTEDLPHFPIMENMLAAVKQRVKLARKLEKLEMQTKRTNAETGWLQKAADEMDIILDENVFYLDDDKEEKAKVKRQINAAREELKYLLAKPIFPKGFSVNYPTSSGQMNIPMVQGNQTVRKAVDVMKNHMENQDKNKKTKMKKLFKKKHDKNDENNITQATMKNNIVKNKNKYYKKNK